MNDKQVAGLGHHRAHNVLSPSSNCCDYPTIDYVVLMLATTSFEDEHHQSMVVAVVSTLIVVYGSITDKLWLTYKDKKDDFRIDSISDVSYTYSFYFRSLPAPKKYFDIGFSRRSTLG